MAEYPDFHGDMPLDHSSKKHQKGNCACGTKCHCDSDCDCTECGCLTCSPVQPCGCKWNQCECESQSDCGCCDSDCDCGCGPDCGCC